VKLFNYKEMPKIKIKTKLRYVIYDKGDPRTLTKIERMLAPTGYGADSRNGKLFIYSEYGSETINVGDGEFVYTYRVMDDEMVGVMEPAVFYKRFQEEVTRKQKNNKCRS